MVLKYNSKLIIPGQAVPTLLSTKTANVLASLPKGMQQKIKTELL
ncbi:MAG: hypothetical protein ACEY3J_04460 [Arsenophonus sp.]